MVRKRVIPFLLATVLALPMTGSTTASAQSEKELTIQLYNATSDTNPLANYGVLLEKNQKDADAVYSESTKAQGTDLYKAANSYRNKNLPAVRNQNPYGTCWAFTSVGLAEADLRSDGINNIDLSELHLAYFNYNAVLDPLGGLQGDKNYVDGKRYNYLTLGGDMAQALYTFASWKGVAAEDKVSYSMAKTSLSTGVSASYCYDDLAHLKNAYLINIKENPEGVKDMVKKHGAVGINYCDSNLYYYEDKNCYYSGKNTSSNHAVMIVGWDDSFSKNNFTGKEKPKSNGAWLIRNSWGKDANCHAGYFWMSYEEPSISTNAYAFDFVYQGKEGFYDNNYQYDGSFANSYIMYGRNNVTYGNVFIAGSGSDIEILKAVGVRFCDSQVNYNIDIYVDLEDEGDPTSGELVSTQTGSIKYEGFYTIDLNEFVVLEKGQKYSVVVSQDGGADKQAVIAIEGNLNWSEVWVAKSHAELGQSFIKSGFGWTDCGKQYNANLRVKAYTDNESGKGAEAGNEYSIEYVLNGGVQNPANPISYKRGKGAKLYNPTKEGMNFKGWYSDKNFENEVSEISKSKAENIKLYAKWQGISASDVKLKAPSFSGIEVASRYVELKWKRANNAEGYYIFRKNGSGSWKKIDTVTNGAQTLYYDEGKKKNGTKYQYKIAAYVKSGTRTITKESAIKTIYYLDAPGISSSTRTGKSTVRLKFGKNKKATGYEIQYSTNAKFKGAKKVNVSKASISQQNIKGIKKGKNYFIRIRAYKKVGKNKFYGYWKTYSVK